MRIMEIKKPIILLILLVLLTQFSFPLIVNAAGIVPCGTTVHIGTDDERCTLCHLIVGIKAIIDYGFTIFGFVAIVGIVIAAIMYIVSTGNETAMQKAKNYIKTILIGFTIVLGAWLIINTVMYLLSAKADLGVTPDNRAWWQFECERRHPLL